LIATPHGIQKRPGDGGRSVVIERNADAVAFDDFLIHPGAARDHNGFA
jgi:hypothetical protein